MMNRYMIPLLATALLTSGCGIGYTRALFVTKTNAGFEVGSTPPTFRLDIGRKEGVVAPQFEQGKKLPLLASFKFGNTGAFAPSVGSAFAAGDAAIALSALYDDDTPGATYSARLGLLSEFDSSLDLSNTPDTKNAVPWFLRSILSKPEFLKNDVRPVFFGTDTTLGIKVAWSGMTGAIPDSATFGYNRKELAWLPITMAKGTGKKAKVKTASLLATLDVSVSATKDAAGNPVLNTDYIQYFATGKAATLLAMQQDVRKAMLARLDPNLVGFKSQFDIAFTKDSDAVSRSAGRVIVAIWRGLKTLADAGDREAAMHLDALNALGHLAPDPARDTVPAYRDRTGTLQEFTLTERNLSDRPHFGRYKAWVESLRTSISIISRFLAKATFQYSSASGDSVTVTAEDQDTRTELAERQRQFADQLTRLSKAVVANKGAVAAVNYYVNRLTK